MHLPLDVRVVHSLLYFIALMLCALGLWQYLPIWSNKYKDRGKGGGLKIHPHTIKTDTVNMCQQNAIVLCGEDVLVETPQSQSSQMAAHAIKDAIKLQL